MDLLEKPFFWGIRVSVTFALPSAQRPSDSI